MFYLLGYGSRNLIKACKVGCPTSRISFLSVLTQLIDVQSTSPYHYSPCNGTSGISFPIPFPRDFPSSFPSPAGHFTVLYPVVRVSSKSRSQRIFCSDLSRCEGTIVISRHSLFRGLEVRVFSLWGRSKPLLHLAVSQRDHPPSVKPLYIEKGIAPIHLVLSGIL